MPVGDYNELDEFRGELPEPSSGGGGGSGSSGGSGNAVLYSTQTPTNAEKLTARTNIGVGPSDTPTFDGLILGTTGFLTLPYVLSPDGTFDFGGLGDLNQFVGGFATTTFGLSDSTGTKYINATDGEIVGYTITAPRIRHGNIELRQADGTVTHFAPAADTDTARGDALALALEAAKALADADGATGFSLAGPLTFDGVSTFYGVATYGGTSHSVEGGALGAVLNSYAGWTNGVIFKLHNTGAAYEYSVLHSFTNAQPWNPQCGLVIKTISGVDYLYGMGGQSNSNGGSVWRLRLTDNTFVEVASLTSTTGNRPYGMPIVAADGNIYFTCSNAGDGTDNFTMGTICKLEPVAATVNTLTKLHAFDNDTEGSNPNSGLVEGAAGTFYGVCAIGGANNFGTLFEYVAGTDTLTVLHDFTGGTDGYYPVGGVLYDAGTLIGTTKQGGTNGYGSVFKYVTGSSTYTANVVAFTGIDGATPGAFPVCGLIKSSDTHYYGATMEGGPYNVGQIFKLTTGGTYSEVCPCIGRIGYYPRGGLTEVGANLFFTTQLGGENRAGDICAIARGGGTVAEQLYVAPGGNANASLFIGPGTYEIEPQRLTYGEFLVQGSGEDNTIIKCKDNTWYKGLFGGTWAFWSVWQSRMTSPRQVHIRDLTLDCNVAGQEVDSAGAAATPAGSAVATGGFNAYATESSIERVRLIHMGGQLISSQQIYGLWFTSAGLQGSYYYPGTQCHGIAKSNRILNCNSSHPFPGSQGAAVIFRNSGDDFTDWLTTAGNGWSCDPLIENCHAFDYTEWSGGHIHGVSGQQTQGLRVTNCSVRNLGDVAMNALNTTLGLWIPAHPSVDTLIDGLSTNGVAHGISLDVEGAVPQTNMRIVNCDLRAHFRGIYADTDTPNLRIENNTITAPVGIEMTDHSSAGVVIQNNLIDASTTAIIADWVTPPTMFNNKDASGDPLPDDGLRTETLLLGEAVGSSSKAHVRGSCDQLLSGTVTWTAASTTITNQVGKTNWGNSERKQLSVGSHINLGGIIGIIASVNSGTDPQTAELSDAPGTNGTNEAAYTDGDLLLVEDNDGTALFCIGGNHWTQIGGALVLGTPHRFNDASPPIGQAIAPSNVVSSTFDRILSGGVTVGASSTTVTGTDTLFQDELSNGDLISINGTVRTVNSIATQTSLTLTDPHPGTVGETVVTYKVPNSHVYVDGDGFVQMNAETTANINAVSGINIEGNTYLNLFATGGTVTIGETTGDISIAGELPSLSLGKTGSSTGELHLLGTTSGEIIIKGAAAAGSYTLTLPTDDGDPSQFLQTDGTGGLSWQTVSTGITIGTTAITSGTDTRVLFQDGTVVGEDAGMTYNKTTDSLTLVGGVSSATIVATTSGAIGLGATSPPTAFTVGDTATSSPRGIMSWQSNTGTDGARLHLRKSRGTFATPTIITSGDTLGRIVATGYDGSAFLEMGSINMVSTGTIGANRIPTLMQFQTATDASPSVLTTAMTIGANGTVTLGDGTAATAILASNLSGATDPTITFGNANVTISSGSDLTLGNNLIGPTAGWNLYAGVNLLGFSENAGAAWRWRKPVLNADGTASAPTVSFEADINTGIFRSGTDTLDITTGGASRLSVSTTGVTTSTVAITSGAGTGLTVNETAKINRVLHKVTVLYTGFAAAALTADHTVCTIPAKTKVVSVYADVTTAFTGGAVSAATLILGKTAGAGEFLASFDCFTAAVTKGLADADMGTTMTRAVAIQGGDLCSWTATTTVVARLTTVTANTNALTAGSVTFYIETETY